MDDRHECGHPRCTLPIRTDRFACSEHWRQLPQRFKTPINRAWQAFEAADIGVFDELEAAQAAAIAWWIEHLS